MGIQDRDYYREGPSFLDRVGAQGATVWLVAITCSVFFGQLLSGHALTRLGVYNPKLILEGEVWRLFTPMFLHADFIHLFLNMFALFWAGQRVEEVTGSREFVLFYLLAGITAQSIYFATYLVGLVPADIALGASGAVLAVLVVFALHFPRARVIFFVVPMPAWGLVVLYIVLNFFGAFGMGERNVGYVVHLCGMFFGLLYHQSGVQFTKLFARGPRAPARPKLRVVPPPVEEHEREPEPVGAPVQAAPRPNEAADEQLEAKLDAVLEKVSKHGQESLTPEEREILFRASELFKKRRK
jgi:membrane associated rhomboid family serine protease